MQELKNLLRDAWRGDRRSLIAVLALGCVTVVYCGLLTLARLLVG